MSFSDADSEVLPAYDLAVDAPLPFDYPTECVAAFGCGPSGDRGFQVESPFSTSLRANDLNLLCQLFIDPIDHLEQATIATTVTIKRERCTHCTPPIPERGQKRRRVSADAKPTKRTSQSQRQKREIASLKQHVEELEVRLAVLQEHKRQWCLATAVGSEAPLTDEGHPTTRNDLNSLKGLVERPTIGWERSWERVAKRRRIERQSTEAESLALRDEIATRWGQMMRLAWPSEASLSGDNPHQRGLADEQNDALSPH